MYYYLMCVVGYIDALFYGRLCCAVCCVGVSRLWSRI